jgi:hypothetical protein
MEGGFPCQLRISIGSHSVRHSFRKLMLSRINTHLNVRGVPAVGRINVVGTSRRSTDEVLQRSKQHVVARPRPGFIEEELIASVNSSVVEKIDGGPSLTRSNAVGVQLPIEVVRAIGVPGISHIGVVLGGTSQRKSVVPTHRVSHDLNQRLHLLIIEFRIETGAGIRRAHQGSRCSCVQSALHTVLKPAAVEGQKI